GGFQGGWEPVRSGGPPPVAGVRRPGPPPTSVVPPHARCRTLVARTGRALAATGARPTRRDRVPPTDQRRVSGGGRPGKLPLGVPGPPVRPPPGGPAPPPRPPRAPRPRLLVGRGAGRRRPPPAGRRAGHHARPRPAGAARPGRDRP